MSEPRRRIRPLLLALLWIWAACIFVVIDLFLDVPEFDRMRPRSALYRGMRDAAHEMVGEPTGARSGAADEFDVRFPAYARLGHGRSAADVDTDTVAHARRLLRIARDPADPEREAALAELARCTGYGARPVVREALWDDDPAVRDAAIEAIVRARSLDELRLLPPDAVARIAAAAEPPRPLAQLREIVAGDAELEDRVRALEEMSERHGADVRDDLLALIRNEEADPRLRRDAARLLARTGPDARVLLDRVMEEHYDPIIRRGVAYGLAETGAAYRLAKLARNPDLRELALDALARTQPGPELLRAVRDPDLDGAARAPLVRALGHSGTGASTLTAVLDAEGSDRSVRIAAVQALANVCVSDYLPVLARACYDDDPEVVQAAESLWKRLTPP